jgi:hypothetical protein
MKMAVFWVVAPCILVEVYRLFRGTCCLHHQGDDFDNGGSKRLWNVGKRLPDFTAQQPRIQPSSRVNMFIFNVKITGLKWYWNRIDVIITNTYEQVGLHTKKSRQIYPSPHVWGVQRQTPNLWCSASHHSAGHTVKHREIETGKIVIFNSLFGRHKQCCEYHHVICMWLSFVWRSGSLPCKNLLFLRPGLPTLTYN